MIEMVYLHIMEDKKLTFLIVAKTLFTILTYAIYYRKEFSRIENFKLGEESIEKFFLSYKYIIKYMKLLTNY